MFSTSASADKRRSALTFIFAIGVFISAMTVGRLLHAAYDNHLPDDTKTLIDGLEKPYTAPSIAGADAWLNAAPLSAQDIKGKVVLVDFWTYSCINCLRTLKHLTEWDTKYRDKGLVIIGVHTPEFEFEKNADNVKKALARYGIKYPVALDNKRVTWDNFANQYWPAHYLINKQGSVVYTHFGEGNYGVTEHNIRYLLGLNSNDSAETAENTTAAQTPETYLGTNRAERFAGQGVLNASRVLPYVFPSQLEKNQWALQGAWKASPEKITANEPNAALRLRFTAKKVFLVMGTATGKPIKAHVKLNNQPLEHDSLTIDSHRLYDIISLPATQEGILEITSQEKGLEVYAFTFE